MNKNYNNCHLCPDRCPYWADSEIDLPCNGPEECENRQPDYETLKAENAELKRSLERACLLFAQKGDCCNCPIDCNPKTILEVTIGECKERLIFYFTELSAARNESAYAREVEG